MALATFLLYRAGRLGGVVGTIGAQELDIDYATEVDLPLKRQTSMLLYHGESDPLIEPHTASKSYEEFTEHGLNFTFEQEPGLDH